ncbi:hypothetical protein H310_05320 [Aphanomyces invadans]|uniref:Uncharacterized protein n=1 Tax=Aphanomyces invadans TaxID=157072 RepID=A0A024U9F3_9STRA|nr:hypothetical protein H310_05320 [Aphanomyces invadans]ETW02840.1 hypothetical protein H310_05320 [Aphanomyces invadans]|eukprot:XP_008868224.1 hypothetical protein H310_05320 [Aphanomyces invadans]
MGKRLCVKPPDALGTTQGDGHEYRGKRTTLPPHEFHTWNYIQDPRNELHPALELGVQSTRTTKFTSGFYRRSRTAIASDRERLAHQAEKDRASTSNAAHRHERLAALNSSYDYNILTGTSGVPKVIKLPPCRKYLGSGTSEFLQHEGTIQLRESANRFYSQWRENPGRADNLTREGLRGQKQSSAIGIGRNEIKSHGAADALSKSLYKQCVEHNTAIKLEYTHVKPPPPVPKVTQERPKVHQPLQYRPKPSAPAWLPPVHTSTKHQQDVDSVRALR